MLLLLFFSAGMKHKMTVFSFQENTTSPSTSSSGGSESSLSCLV